jgi:RND superfamily putative drug exporter
MLRSLATWCYRHRRIVVTAWVVLLVGTIGFGSTVESAFAQSFSLPGTESQRATDLLRQRFPARAGDAGQIVFEADAGVTSPQVKDRVEALLAAVAKVPHVIGATSPYNPAGGRQISTVPGRAGKIAYASVQFAERSSEVPLATANKIISLADQARAPGLRVELSGQMFQARGSVGSASEAIGLLAAVLILLFTFGSVLAMGLPIMTALFGIGIGLTLVTVLSHVMAMPEFTTQLASMIGIGVGVDYALFIVTRYRQGLHDGLDPERSVVLAIDTAGRAVLFAGTTVVISLFGLFLMGVAFVRGLAVGTSLTVALIMLASITLLPSVLGFAGVNVDKLSVRRHRKEGVSRRSVAFRWSRLVQRRPWPFAIAGLLVLVVLAVPLFSLRLGFSDAGNNPTSETTRQSYDLLARGFGPGFNGPLVLAAEYPKGTDPAVLDGLRATLAKTPGVAAVGTAIPSPVADAAVLQVVPTTSPQSAETVRLIEHLRNDVIPAALKGSPVQVHVGGITAAGVDVSDKFSSRLLLFIAAVLALSFLLLMMVFRSLVVPLKAVVMNLLSIGAAYGVSVAVFQWGWGASLIGIHSTAPIEPFIPVMLFAIVFGLSMDYEVFLLSRVREEYDRTGDNAGAVADGLAATARVITAAAAIMVTVFASFVFGDNRIVKLFGFGLAFAIFVDATLVRMVLVPATMELLGDRNWWFPRWLDRITPQLRVEAGPELEAEIERLLHVEEPVAT